MWLHQILVVHPEDSIVNVAVQRSFKPTSLKRKKLEITNSLEDLCTIKNYSPENLHIRVTRFPLAYGAHVINPDSETGILYIKLYPFQVDGQKPKFVLRAAYGGWYDEYVKELKSLWNSAENWSC